MKKRATSPATEKSKRDKAGVSKEGNYCEGQLIVSFENEMMGLGGRPVGIHGW